MTAYHGDVDLEAAELQQSLARQRADQAAWHAYNAMERSIGGVRTALDDPELGPEWSGQLRAVCLRAGALAVGKEAC